MGLQENKWIRSIEEEYLVSFNEDIEKILGVTINVDFDWESFPSADVIKFVPTYSFDRIKSAIREVASDVDGKAAILEQVKNIKIKNIIDDAENAKNLRLADETLYFEVGFGGNHTTVFTDSAIKDYLENNL